MATGAVSATITALFRTIFSLPPSPGWLANKGKIKIANRIIGKILGHKWGISRHFKRPKENGSSSWTILFSKKYLRRTMVGGIFYACQTFAFFGISIFLPILLTGMNIKNPQVLGNLYNISMLLGIFLFNHLSRRAFLISNFLLSTFLIGLLGLLPHAPSSFKLLLFSIFAIILSSGLVLDYPYPTELFDDSVQAGGVGTCITISRIGAAAGTFLLPVLTNAGGVNLAMLVCACVLFAAFLVCLIWAPETAPKYLKKNK